MPHAVAYGSDSQGVRMPIRAGLQDDDFPEEGSQFGVGDINTTLFFAPKRPTETGVTWGVGPVLLLPAATDSLIGGKKWGGGPAAVGLVLRGPWTADMLANHAWPFTGNDDHPGINDTLMQSFAGYIWPSAWTASLQTETSYNREAEQWAVCRSMRRSTRSPCSEGSRSACKAGAAGSNLPTARRRGSASGCRRISCRRGGRLNGDVIESKRALGSPIFASMMIEVFG